jgi:hypothetical protein
MDELTSKHHLGLQYVTHLPLQNQVLPLCMVCMDQLKTNSQNGHELELYFPVHLLSRLLEPT